MNRNKRSMKPEEYLEEFKLTLSELYKDHKAEFLFKEWPIDVKYFRDKKNKPIYTLEAEYFLNNYSITPKQYFDIIKPLNRTLCYRQENHSGKQTSNGDNAYTTEKVEAKALFNSIKDTKYPFVIIDYEVPLREHSSNKGIGEIDLIGKKGDTVFLLELKKFKDPNGALFHMILQSYTYMKLLNMDNFKKEYECKKVIPAILFFEGSENCKQFNDPRNVVFKELLKHLDMKAFVVKRKANSVFKDDKDIYTDEKDKPILRYPVEIVELN